MKKILFSALILSLLLATLTACGAEAKQATEPEPTPKIEEPKPEPLAAPKKTEEDIRFMSKSELKEKKKQDKYAAKFKKDLAKRGF